MANGPLNCQSACQLRILKALHSSKERGSDFQTRVSSIVSDYRHKRFALKNPAGATLTVGDVGDTMYKEQEGEVNGWGKFYLPDIVSMQVVGAVKGTSCPCDQLVLMTCEDEKLYAYDGEGEELHLVASNLQQLFKEGIEYPASKRYYRGEAFENMTEKDWDKVRRGPEGKRLDQEHNKLITMKKSKFLENLKSTRLGACS